MCEDYEPGWEDDDLERLNQNEADDYRGDGAEDSNEEEREFTIAVRIIKKYTVQAHSHEEAEDLFLNGHATLVNTGEDEPPTPDMYEIEDEEEG